MNVSKQLMQGTRFTISCEGDGANLPLTITFCISYKAGRVVAYTRDGEVVYRRVEPYQLDCEVSNATMGVIETKRQYFDDFKSLRELMLMYARKWAWRVEARALAMKYWQPL